MVVSIGYNASFKLVKLIWLCVINIQYCLFTQIIDLLATLVGLPLYKWFGKQRHFSIKHHVNQRLFSASLTLPQTWVITKILPLYILIAILTIYVLLWYTFDVRVSMTISCM